VGSQAASDGLAGGGGHNESAEMVEDVRNSADSWAVSSSSPRQQRQQQHWGRAVKGLQEDLSWAGSTGVSAGRSVDVDEDLAAAITMLEVGSAGAGAGRAAAGGKAAGALVSSGQQQQVPEDSDSSDSVF
jgi:hypothetical protein